MMPLITDKVSRYLDSQGIKLSSIEHAGVKGMKWGVRKARKKAQKKTNLDDMRIRGLERLYEFQGDAKKANRQSTKAFVFNVLQGAATTTVLGIMTAKGRASPASLIGASIVSTMSAAGQLSTTLDQIKSVNLAFEPLDNQ